MPKNIITIPLIDQIVRCATSIGANYMEANGASSTKDFRNKICIVKKECKETLHFLRMMAIAEPDKENDLRLLAVECQELSKIFSKIACSSKSNK